ncbi:hypothetical protein [Polycyclovorans algicola]|uniref:hypothetical protein n=1 Tax=Polycyclovorans algicola TaxID=616992 RepID=UPI001268D506|nr:hypothetical protein [Polycyclovorans algicola]
MALSLFLSGLAIGPAAAESEYDRLDPAAQAAFQHLPPAAENCQRTDLKARDDRGLSALYRTRVAEARDKPANFAGCWVMQEVGCGTSCQAIFALHKPSGAVVWFSSASEGVAHTLGSAAVLLNPNSYWDDSVGPMPDYLQPMWEALVVCRDGRALAHRLSVPPSPGMDVESLRAAACWAS